MSSLFAECDQRQPQDCLKIVELRLLESNAPPKDVKAIEQAYVGKEYSVDELRERIRNEFQQRGYFKAVVGNPEVIRGGDHAAPTAAVTFPVKEGLQYHLTTMQFEYCTSRHCDPAGSSEKSQLLPQLFNSKQLRQYFPITDGEIFDIGKIREGLGNLQSAFSEDGYINFTAVPKTDLDEHVAVVAVTIDLQSGPQFRFGSMKVVPDSDLQAAAVKSALQSLRGAIYSPGALKRALESGGFHGDSDRDVHISRRDRDSLVDIVVDLSENSARLH
jgi:outer membrane protein assembly factor BamA